MPKSKEWIDGYLAALRTFSWWKDGILYVGSGVCTYKEIEDELLRKNPGYKDNPKTRRINED